MRELTLTGPQKLYQGTTRATAFHCAPFHRWNSPTLTGLPVPVLLAPLVAPRPRRRARSAARGEGPGHPARRWRHPAGLLQVAQLKTRTLPVSYTSVYHCSVGLARGCAWKILSSVKQWSWYGEDGGCQTSMSPGPAEKGLPGALAKLMYKKGNPNNIGE